MASYDGHVKIGTKLDTSGLEKGLNGIGGFAKQGFSVIGNAAAAMGKAAIGAVAAVGSAVAGLGVYAAKVGSDFEAGMSKVEAISGASGAELEALTEKAEEMGAKTKFSAAESAEAMQYMAMAGWKTEDMLNGIEGIMNLAAASGEDLATTSDIVTDALTAFGLTAADSTHFADVLAQASSNANTNVGLMGETFKYVAPVAGALGYSAEDAATAIGLMANAGIKGSQAGTSLRSIMSRLAKPTDEVQAAMDALGISLTDSEGNMKSLNEIMGDLRKGFSGLSEAEAAQIAAALGGQEAMSGLLAIVNASDTDFEKLQSAIYSCDGAAAQMADTMNDNLQGQLTIMKSAAEGFGLAIYKGLQEPLTDIAKFGTECIGELTEAFKTGGVDVLIEAGGRILGDIIIGAAQKLPDLINLAVSTVGSFLDAILQNLPNIIASGGQILLKLIEGIGSILPRLGSVAGQILSYLVTGLLEHGPEIIQSGAETLNSFLIGVAAKLPDVLTTAADLIIMFAESLTHPATLSNILNAAISIIEGLAAGLLEALPRLAMAVPTIMANIVTTLISNIPRLLVAAVNILSSLARYLLESVGVLLAAIPKLFNDMVKGFVEQDWGQIGRNIIDGIVNGVVASTKRLVSSVVDAAKDAVNGVKNFLGIHSPSKLMRDMIGKNMIAGINVGVDGEASELESHATRVVKDTVQSMQRVNASDAVASLRGQSLRRTESVEANSWKYTGYPENGSPNTPQKIVLEKGSITGEVTMDGEKVGTLVAPTVDVEIEKARRESER